ncbi:MAG: hypothetical protein IPO87_13900 [Flavobacteriales bacterium]|nr:hypothetical protein [Flavobacteriales bacterium]
MKTLSLLFVLSMFAGTVAAQTEVITVLRNGQSFFHYDVSQLATLISTTSPDHTMPGDTIILPGGAISCPNIGIDKPLTIVGAGILQSGATVTDVTQWTSTTPNQGSSPGFYINSGGAGSSFHGIVFNSAVRFSGAGNNATTFSASFERCSLRGGPVLSTQGLFSSVGMPSEPNSQTMLDHWDILRSLQHTRNEPPSAQLLHR